MAQMNPAGQYAISEHLFSRQAIDVSVDFFVHFIWFYITSFNSMGFHYKWLVRKCHFYWWIARRWKKNYTHFTYSFKSSFVIFEQQMCGLPIANDANWCAYDETTILLLRFFCSVELRANAHCRCLTWNRIDFNEY